MAPWMSIFSLAEHNMFIVNSVNFVLWNSVDQFKMDFPVHSMEILLVLPNVLFIKISILLEELIWCYTLYIAAIK